MKPKKPPVIRKGQKALRHKTPKKAKPVGRPTMYRKIFAVRAAKLCLLGATDKDLADFFGVTVFTISLWKKTHLEFSLSIASTKATPNDRAKKTLYQRAIGYSYEDTDIRVVKGRIVQTPIIKHALPDTTALMFWMRNREPKEWRERTETTIQNATDQQFKVKVEQDPFKEVSTERLREIAAMAMAVAEPEAATTNQS